MASVRTLFLAAGCAAVFSTSIALHAQAQEAWPFISYEAYRYDSLVNTEHDVGLPCCAPHVVAMPGHALIHISAVIDVPWSDELDRVSIYARDLTLTVGDAEPLSPFGAYDYRGIFEASSSSLSASRPRDFPDADEHLLMEMVWAVPEDATMATLTFGEYFSTEIDIPQSVSEPVMPADTASFEITGITPVERIDVGFSSYNQTIQGVVAADAGQIVQLDFTLTPLMETWLDGRSGFLLRTRHLQLVGPDGLPTLPLGQHLNQALTNDTVNSISGDSFLNQPFDYTFYFLTDGTLGTYTLYFLSDPVAEATIE